MRRQGRISKGKPVQPPQPYPCPLFPPVFRKPWWANTSKRASRGRGEMGLLPRGCSKNTNYSRRLTQSQLLGLPGCQQLIALRSELNELGGMVLPVMFRGWEGQIIPHYFTLSFPHSSKRLEWRRGIFFSDLRAGSGEAAAFRYQSWAR